MILQHVKVGLIESLSYLVCQYYLLSDLMEKAKEVGSEMASKTATAATKFAAKAKASLSKGFEQSKQKVKENTKKSSFFSKALQWTRELTKDITEEYQKSEVADRNRVQESVPSNEPTEVSATEAHPVEACPVEIPAVETPPDEAHAISTPPEAPEGPTEITSQDASQDPSQLPSDIPITNLDTLNVDDIVKLPSLIQNPACTYFTLTELKTSTGIIGGENYSVVLQGQLIALIKRLGATNCVIVDLRKLSSLDKMTKKKDDPNIVTLSFDNGSQGMMWRIHLKQSLELCTAITAVLSAMD